MRNSIDNFVSIVIVAFNCSDVIYDCIESCLEEQNVEIIVIDNASKDNTSIIIDSFDDSRILFIKNTTNFGFTYACNQGISVARGEFVFLLNPDAVLLANCVDNLKKIFINMPKVGIVAPCLYFPDGSFQNYTRRFPTVLGLWVESFVPMRFWNYFSSYKNYTCQDIDFSIINDVEQPAGAAIMFRNNHLLDESYFIYGSDLDLCKTLHDEGFRIVQIPNASVLHHQSKAGTNVSKTRIFLDLDNYYGMFFFFRKHHQRLDAIIYKVLFGTTLFVRLLIEILKFGGNLRGRWLKLYLFILNKNFTAIYKHEI